VIYKAIKYILENDSDFATAIGTDDDSDIKVYPIHPRKQVSLPFCVFSITDQRGNPSKDRKSYNGIDEIRIRVSVFDDDLDTAIDLSEKARIALDNQKHGGTFNSVVIQNIDFENMNDTFAENYGNRGALGIDMNYNIWSTP
jgi:hypothetical protein